MNRSRWLDWQPKAPALGGEIFPETPSHGIDKDGRRASVSSVSAAPEHIPGNGVSPSAAKIFPETPTWRTDRTDKSPLAAVPVSWIEGVSRLLRQDAPDSIPPDRWRQLRIDAERLLSAHGEEAARLGWHTLDLFGSHRAVPLARLDCLGLALLLRGRDVIGLESEVARIATKSGSLTFRRREQYPSEARPLWTLCP